MRSTFGMKHPGGYSERSLSETKSLFGQLDERGESNSYLQSDLALRARFIDDLLMVAASTARDNSDVPGAWKSGQLHGIAARIRVLQEVVPGTAPVESGENYVSY